MLCPHGEAGGDGPLFRLGLSSLGMYRSFVGGLRDETGVDAEYLDAGTLVLAATDDEWGELQRRCDWQVASGLETSVVGPAEVRDREPRLTLDIRGALFCPTDHQVHPRRLLEALRKACVIRGVDIRCGAAVDEVVASNGRATGARCGSQVFDAPRVVVAAGTWSGHLAGLSPSVETRPRKGQILALETSGAAFRHVVRWQQFYLTPRLDGQLVVGATNEDRGFDRSLTVTGLKQLLDVAARMSAEVDGFRIAETWTGLRPQTPDGLPAIGRAGIDGLFYAFGHYRNGILLTPVTAQILGDAVRGRNTDETAQVFSPMRFGNNEVRSGSAGRGADV